MVIDEHLGGIRHMVCYSHFCDMLACDLQYLVLKRQVKRRRDDQAGTREVRDLHMKLLRQLVNGITCEMRCKVIIMDDPLMEEARLKRFELRLHFLVMGDIPLQVHLPEDI